MFESSTGASWKATWGDGVLVNMEVCNRQSQWKTLWAGERAMNYWKDFLMYEKCIHDDSMIQSWML